MLPFLRMHSGHAFRLGRGAWAVLQCCTAMGKGQEVLGISFYAAHGSHTCQQITTNWLVCHQIITIRAAIRPPVWYHPDLSCRLPPAARVFQPLPGRAPRPDRGPGQRPLHELTRHQPGHPVHLSRHQHQGSLQVRGSGCLRAACYFTCCCMRWGRVLVTACGSRRQLA